MLFRVLGRGLAQASRLFAVCLLGVIATGAQEALTNGARHDASLTAPGETDSWTFSAAAGSRVIARIGSTNFPPRLRIFDASNTLIAEAAAGNVNTRDVIVSATITNAGTISVLASSINNSIGGYGLHFVLVPAQNFTASPGDEGGVLQSGASNPATLSLGDLDAWTFAANAGDRFMARMGAAFTPTIRVYDPNGALAAEANAGNVNTRDVVASGIATNAGTYVVIAMSTFSGGAGAYNLTFAKAPGEVVVSPGDEGGVLTNGVDNLAQLANGDLDVWHFTANAGDSLMLRMGGAFTPNIRLHGPDGAIVDEAVSGNVNTRDVVLTATATNSGTYIVIASSTVASGAGEYHLHLAKAPGQFFVSSGDQGGDLVNGADNPGVIDRGDLDLWRFSANAGDQVILRMGGQFTPWIRLHAPDGALVAEALAANVNTRDVALSARATNSGTYLVVVSSTVASGVGNYNLHLAQSPEEFVVSAGDQGGDLENGASHTGNLSLGDLDLWRFNAQAGESFLLRVGGQFTPSIRVYGPNGEIAGDAVAGNVNTRDVALSGTATNAGSYMVVVQSTVASGVGDYLLSFLGPLSPLTISPGDHGGTLVNGRTNLATLALGDFDVWSFTGTVGDSNVFRVTATSVGPWLRLYGPTGALVAESFPANVNTRSAAMSYELTNNPGTYTIAIGAGFSGQNGGYSFKQSRWAPDLTVPASTAIDEGETLSVSIFAEDPDEPLKPLQFTLVSGPPGAALALSGPTNAAITWPTSEATGPATNQFVVTVTDVVNNRSFTRTNSFNVVVREINVAPQLTVPASITLNELTPLDATASATDIDLPPNPLTFSLFGAPEGMTINPQSGAISWLPSEVQGSSTNIVLVIVTDDSPNAANEKNLSATNSLTVIVREVNVSPVLTVPGPQQIDELGLLSLTLAATDPDLPVNSRTFALLSGPSGMTLDPLTGDIRWTPGEAQGPSTNVVTVAVTDSNPPAVNAIQMSATNTFTVLVREVNSAPELTVPAQETVTELMALSIPAIVVDGDLPTNAVTFTLNGAPTGMSINSSSGLITWTPTETQGPSTNIVAVIVTDSNPSASNSSLSITNNFTVIVTETNSAPSLPAQSNRTIAEGSTLMITNTASDADLPANLLIYTLVAGPSNAVLNADGLITWIPGEAQGPSTNTFTTVVTDNGTPALSATNTFTVVVSEINASPVVAAITNRFVRFGELLSLQVSASDSDLPANMLTYAAQGPSGLTIDANTGLVRWTPTQAQVGTHSVSVLVSDNGQPSATVTSTFQVTVSGEETSLGIERLTTGLMQITIRGNAGVNYELQRSTNLVNWEMQFEFRLTTSPFLYIDPDSQAQVKRFYRLRTAP